MANEITPAPDAALLEQVLIGGDLAKLTPAQRLEYYLRVCNQMGLDPTTKPFDYLMLNGKLRLYANRNCAEQLRKIHSISVYDMTSQVMDDVYVVRAKFKTPDGRTDEATGAVPIAGLKGEAKSNAMLKAETKCKNRGTYSIRGLGMLDESEVESIPGAKTGEAAITASQPPPMPRRLSEAIVPIVQDHTRELLQPDRPLIVPDEQVITPADEPVTQEESRAIYGAMRAAIREIGQNDKDPAVLAHAKAAVKQWAAAELGIQHLEDCPVGKPYLRLRGEIGRLVADAFEPGSRG